MTTHLMKVEYVCCPVCGSDDRVKMPDDWPERVNSGETIPLIGCGNPWHYDNYLDRPWAWLRSTGALQTEAFGYDLEFLAAGATADDKNAAKALAHYLDWNVTAAGQELAEARGEFSWKPWAVDKPFTNRERMIEEMVDTMHFIGNILVGLGVTDEEYEEAYRKKQQKNRDRMASGTYSAKKGTIYEGSEV